MMGVKILMEKADLFDDIRSRIGVLADRCGEELAPVYPFVCELLAMRVKTYSSVLIYLVEKACFKKSYYSGKLALKPMYIFGDGMLSIAAVRGGVVYEKRQNTCEVYFPFYSGHHLIGVMVVLGELDAEFDDADLTLLAEITSLFEAKLKGRKI
jgi:L-methionine (R)-S-oxide reductase